VSFGVSGLIEGFYDRLWTAEERNRVAEFIAEHGFDTYVYAPKNDRLQNGRWREPYREPALAELAAFGDRCRAMRMALWVGLRPINISYADDADATRVVDKLRRYRELGADRLLLLTDDIPAALDAHAGDRFASLADAHAWLLGFVVDALDGAPIAFCPTDYFGLGTPYLETLGRELPPDVDVCWTGRDVCSPAITSDEADRLTAVLRRRPLIWDNYPVNDATMQAELHIGPIRGRSADLDEHVAGIIVNPALQPEATLIPLATWGEYLRDPRGYDPDAAWRRALLDVAPDVADEVSLLAASFDRSVIAQPWRRLPAERVAMAVARVLAGQNRRLVADLAPFVAE
jgi:hyaluronoglucosaminidase